MRAILKSDFMGGYRAHITAGTVSIMVLRFLFAAYLLAIGADKILHTDIISVWTSLVGPVIHTLLPLPLVTVVSIEGIVEIILGVVLLTTWIRIGSIILLLTTLLLCVDLFILGINNLALHDLLFCAGVVVLFSHYNRVRQIVEV